MTPKLAKSMEAAVAHAPLEPLTIESVAIDAPQGDEVLVRVVAAGICHTDVMVKSNGLCPFPIVLGHEGAGVVEAIGPDVTGVGVGDHVVMSFAACGQCFACSGGKPSYCVDHGSLNFSGVSASGRATICWEKQSQSSRPALHGAFFQQSSFASYSLCSVRQVVKVDRTLSLSSLAPLGCGIQTGAGAVMNSLSVKPGATIAVFGCGAVGLSAIMAARAVGAKSIAAVDIRPSRLALARELGADLTVNPRDDSGYTDKLRKLGQTGLDYAIDTTGVPAVLRQAVEVCGVLGTTAMIAPGKPGTEVTIEMLQLLPGKSLRGVVQGDSDPKVFLPTLLDLWKKGLFPFEKMITKFDGLASINDAMTAMEDPHRDVIKPVLVLDRSHDAKRGQHA